MNMWRKGGIRRNRAQALVAAGLALVWAGTPEVWGANKTWTGASDTTFSTTGNWSGGVPANDTTTDTGVFSGTPTVNQPSLTATRSIAGLNFQTAGWTLSGSTLTLGAGGISSAGSGTVTISAPVAVGVAGGTWTIGTGNTLDMSGVLSLGNAYTVNGGGTLRLSGSSANTMTGTLTLSAGSKIEANKVGVSPFGDTQPVVVDGTVKWLQSGSLANTVQFTVDNGGLVDLNGYNAGFAFSGNQKITLSGGTVQTGTGTWTFTGNNAAGAIVNGTTVSTITGKVDFGGAATARGVTIYNNASGLDSVTQG